MIARLLRPFEWPMITKLLATLGIVAFLPLAVTSLVGYNVARQTVLQIQARALSGRAKDLAEQLDLLLAERQADIQQFAHSSAVTAFSSDWQAVSSQVQQDAQENLENLVTANRYFQAVYLMNREGEVILSTADNVGLNFGFRPYFQASLAGKPYISDLSISVDLGEPVIYFSAPVLGGNGEVAAVAVLRVWAEEIWSVVEAERDMLGSGSLAILFDEYGLRLAHSTDRSLIFKAVVPLDPQVEAQLLAERRLGEMDHIESKDLPDLAEGLRLADSQPYFTHHLVISDELYHAGAARLSNKPWTVIESVPEPSFLSPISGLAWANGWIVSVVALLTWLAGLTASRRIAKPVQELSAAARRLAGGELDRPLSHPGVPQGDEIGMLQYSFESMRTSLKESYAQLQARNLRLQRLYELAITLTGDITAVTDRVVNIVSELLEVQVAVVGEIHGDKNVVLSMHENGQIVHQGELPLRGSPCEEVQEEKQYKIFDQAVRDFPEDAFLVERGLNSYLGGPILDSRGEVIGVINAMDHRARQFAEEDIHLLQTLAKRVGVEIEQARAEAGVRRRQRYLVELAAIGQLLLPAEEVLPALPEILQRLGMAAGVSRAYVFQNHRDQTGHLLTSQRAEWTDGRAAAQMGNPELQNFPLEQIFRWIETLGQGNELAGLVRDFPPQERAILEPQDIRSILMIPIFAGGAWWGFIGFDDCVSERQWFEVDREMLRTAASLIGQALARAALLDEVQQRAGELQAIAEVGGLVTAGNTLQVTLNSLAKKIAEAADFDAVGMGLYNGEEEKIAFPALYARRSMKLLEARKDSTARLEEAPVLQQLLRDKHHIYFADPQNDPRIRGSQRQLVKEDGVQAILTWPLLFGGELIGTLDLVSTQPRTFAPEEISLLSTLADQTAAAVQNARLFDETQQRLRETTLLLELSAALRTTLSSQEMLPVLLDFALTGLDVQGALYLEPDELSGELRATLGRGDFQPLEGDARPLTALPRACATRTGQPCHGQPDCPYFPNSGRPYRIACVPIKVGEQILGGLHVGARRAQPLTASEMRLLNGIADIAANALRRAALFEEVRLYKDAINSTADAVIITDLQSRILDVNPSFEQITGYSRAEALGQKPSLVKSQHSTPEFYQKMWQQILTRGSWSGEIINRRKNGQEWDSLLTISTVKDIHGQPVAYIGINRDITEKNRREREHAALLSVAESLRNAANREEMFPIILDQLLVQINAAGAALALRDEQSGEGVVELARGAWAPGTGVRLPAGQGLSGHIIATGQLYQSDDIRTDPRFSHHHLLDEQHAVIGAPLIANEVAFGALWVGRQTPFDRDEVSLLMAVANMAANAIRRATYHEQTLQLAEELLQAYDSTLEGWACALELRDQETEGHTRRVTDLTLQLARMMGMGDGELIQVRRGALLHDIGKMGIPDGILLKPGPLTDEEWAIMRQHPVYACNMLQPILYLRPALDIPCNHHEKWNGSGYPQGLKGEEIPLPARIFAIVDVYDALTSDRPYRKAWPEDRVLHYIREQSGSHFDPAVVEAFLEWVVKSK